MHMKMLWVRLTYKVLELFRSNRSNFIYIFSNSIPKSAGGLQFAVVNHSSCIMGDRRNRDQSRISAAVVPLIFLSGFSPFSFLVNFSRGELKIYQF